MRLSNSDLANKLTRNALKAHVKERLGSVHTPKEIHFFEQLPRSSVGKVLKTAIREQLQPA